MRNFFLQNKPLIYVIGFNLLTIFIFLISPFQWQTDNIFSFALLSLISQSFIILGFKIGFKRNKRINNVKYVFETLNKKNINLFFLFYSATFLIKYAYLLRFQPYEVKEMFLFLSVGVVDPQLGYSLSLDSTRAFTVPWVLFFLISIVNQIFFIVGFLSWRNISMMKKIIFVVFLMIEVFYWMGRGTNFGVISLITTFLLCTMFQSNIKIKFKNTAKKFLLVVSLLFISIWFFSNNMTKRSGDSDVNLQDFNLGNSVVDENHFIFSVIPSPLHQTYMYVSSYLSQGYYHTCLAFDLEFKPTFFLANNPAIISFADIFGIQFYEDTYVFRLKQKGVDPEINWHSSYTWFASDFSFIGVPFIFFFMGFFFGFSWNRAKNNDDFLSKIIFVIVGNCLFYTFANNNYLSSVFYSFIFLLPLWYFTRVKRLN